MAVRTSMTDLVLNLRSRTGAATDDVFQGITYWSGDQLQNILDSFKHPQTDVVLTALPQKITGVKQWLVFRFDLVGAAWVEPFYVVRDSSGTAVMAPYTVEITERYGYVTFASDHGSGSLTIDFTSYDANMAAAEVWSQKAAQRYDFINLKGGDHSFSAEQEYTHCVDRAAYFRAKRIRSFGKKPSGYALR